MFFLVIIFAILVAYSVYQAYRRKGQGVAYTYAILSAVVTVLGIPLLWDQMSKLWTNTATTAQTAMDSKALNHTAV